MASVLLMVGTPRGAFLLWSDEKREHWKIQGPMIKGWEVNSLYLDQRREPVLYACVGHYVYGPTIHVSRDLGREWVQAECSPRFPEGSYRTLERMWFVTGGHLDEPEVLYGGVAEAGLFVSRDSGGHWHEVESLNNHPTRGKWCRGLGGLCCHDLLLDPHDKDRMWVSISAAGVFRTDDGGKSWAMKNKGLPVIVPPDQASDIASCVHRLVVSPENPDVLYQQNHGGVYRSHNAGDSWHPIHHGLPMMDGDQGVPMCFGMPMVMHPANDKTLFVIPEEIDYFRFFIDGRLAVFRTRDGGDSWHALTNGLQETPNWAGVLRYSMSVDNLAECGIYFGTTCGQIFYSLDEGEDWRSVPVVLPRILSLSAAILD